MSLTFQFVSATPHRAVYKVTSSSGGSGTLTNQGAATPDIATDIPNGLSPLGTYLAATVASDAAAQLRINYTANFSATLKGSQSSSLALSTYGTVQAVRNATSGKVDFQCRLAGTDDPPGNAEGVLELEYFHTIAK